MNAPTITAPDRTRFLGGSDAAAVLGVSPWKTPVDLWMEKTGRKPRDEPSAAQVRVQNRGKKLEPVVLDMVLDKLCEQGHEVALLTRNARYIDPDHPFLSCEIDFELLLDGEHINGDCKTVIGFARKKWGEEETEDVPIEYAAQFMHGLMVTGRRRCLVAALIGLDDVAIYWINHDDETIAAMRAKEVAFWTDHVLGDVAPDPFVFDDITALFPLDDGTAIECDETIALKVQDLNDIRGRLKVLEEKEAALKFEIADFISPHAYLKFQGKEIASWKAQQATRLDQKALKVGAPEIFTKFSTTSTCRVLRLKK